MSKKANEDKKKRVLPVKRLSENELGENEYPHLHAELEDEPHLKATIEDDQPRSTMDDGFIDDEGHSDDEEDLKPVAVVKKTDVTDPLAGFDPKAEDFIRRASSAKEAEEIITYLYSRKEISLEQKNRLLEQIKKRGLESFGKHKSPGYYWDQYEEAQDEAQIDARRKKIRKIAPKESDDEDEED